MDKAHLEKADWSDRDLIFEWANESEARKNSIHTDKIEYVEHLDWFTKKLKDKDCDFYIYYTDKDPVGQIRLDYKEGFGRISFSVDRRFRGQGHGGSMLKLAEEKVKANRPDVYWLTGIVKKENIASQKKFEELNYERIVNSDENLIGYQKKIKEMSRMYIPYGRQWIDEDDIKAVAQTLRSDFLTTGPKVAEFEKIVAEYVGAKYAVAVSNGTAALHIACLAAGIKEGDEVITTPITFVASANCVMYCGATPVFADINPETYNIDPREIRKKITDRTKAIIAVHFTGQPCEMDEIRQIAKEHKLLVIEDAAHALGADYKGKKIGSISDMTTFSFHPVKHITTGEGGMVMTDNKELYQRLCLFRSHGITRDQSLMTDCDDPWFYQQLELGFNYRMTDIECALGISQMKKLNSFIARRREIADRYNKAFAGIDSLIIPAQKEGCNNSWHLYVIQVNSKDRKAVFNGLVAKGIGVNVHYIPVHTQPYYRNHGYSKVACPKAEKAYSGFISLPMYAKLTNEEQDYVIEQVKALL